MPHLLIPIQTPRKFYKHSQNNVKIDEVKISSKEENNADSENETENPREEKQFLEIQTRAQSKAK